MLPMGLCVICTGGADNEALAQLPPSEILSPVLLAVAARGIYDLLASPLRAKPGVFKLLQDSFLSEKGWHREGIYLYMKKEPKTGEWPVLFQKFMDAGFLLPPTPLQPLILPGELSEGEAAKLCTVLSTL